MYQQLYIEYFRNNQTLTCQVRIQLTENERNAILEAITPRRRFSLDILIVVKQKNHDGFMWSCDYYGQNRSKYADLNLTFQKILLDFSRYEPLTFDYGLLDPIPAHTTQYSIDSPQISFIRIGKSEKNEDFTIFLFHNNMYYGSIVNENNETHGQLVKNELKS